MLGLLIVIGLVLIAVFADVLAPYSPYIGDLRTTRLLPPSAAHWFGTDDQGRDILSRLIYGSRITLLRRDSRGDPGRAHRARSWAPSPAIRAGCVDAALMRITDIFLAFPRLILALAFVAALGPGIENAVHRHRDHVVAAVRADRARRDADHPAAPTTSPPCS